VADVFLISHLLYWIIEYLIVRRFPYVKGVSTRARKR